MLQDALFRDLLSPTRSLIPPAAKGTDCSLTELRCQFRARQHFKLSKVAVARFVAENCDQQQHPDHRNAIAPVAKANAGTKAICARPCAITPPILLHPATHPAARPHNRTGKLSEGVRQENRDHCACADNQQRNENQRSAMNIVLTCLIISF